MPSEYRVDKKLDIMLEMAIGQGYVPKDCYLKGGLVIALVNEGKDPCVGCNLDRTICHGRPCKKRSTTL